MSSKIWSGGIHEKRKKNHKQPQEYRLRGIGWIGICLWWRIIPGHGKGIILRNSIPKGKVTLLVGGGSGHEPLFGGFVGKNMADGAVAGNIFAAPTPDQILLATEKLNKGNGVLYLYGNYAGDILNFDMAAELAADEGIETKTVRVWDDVASAPPERFTDRRGIAGDFFVIKIAGAAAAKLNTLEEVYLAACKARDNTRSIGVAVSPGTFPETGEPTFELADDEIEIGMGLHGEKGVSRSKMMSADAIVDFNARPRPARPAFYPRGPGQPVDQQSGSDNHD